MILLMKILNFQTGHPWFSILTRTGVFKGKENHDKFSADLVSPCVSLEKNHEYTCTFFFSLFKFLWTAVWSYGYLENKIETGIFLLPLLVPQWELVVA